LFYKVLFDSYLFFILDLRVIKAFGGGAELILATDFRLMCPAAEICFQEARMGVGTLCGGGYFLPKLVGRGKALDLLLTCRKIKSEEARAIGLVDGELIPGDSLDEEKRIQFGQRWLEERVKSHNASVVQTIKNIVHSEDLELEKEFFAESWGGAAQLEAISSLSIKHK
jgi:enoyl-CoA hydratase/carnithine racemase